MSTAGERLREERQRLEISQVRLAEIGGVQKRAQINYEQGGRVPDGAYLAAVAAAGVDVLYVLTGDRAPFNAKLAMLSHATKIATSIPVSTEQQMAIRDALLASMSSPAASRLLADWARCNASGQATISRMAEALASASQATSLVNEPPTEPPADAAKRARPAKPAKRSKQA